MNKISRNRTSCLVRETMRLTDGDSRLTAGTDGRQKHRVEEEHNDAVFCLFARVTFFINCIIFHIIKLMNKISRAR